MKRNAFRLCRPFAVEAAVRDQAKAGDGDCRVGAECRICGFKSRRVGVFWDTDGLKLRAVVFLFQAVDERTAHQSYTSGIFTYQRICVDAAHRKIQCKLQEIAVFPGTVQIQVAVTDIQRFLIQNVSVQRE